MSLLLPTESTAAAVADREAWRVRRAAMEAEDGGDPAALRRVAKFHRRVTRMKRLISGSLKLTGLYGAGVRNALDIRLAEQTLTLPRLPASFDGYRILHLTDPHFDALSGLGPALIRAVQGLEVDLALLTGDYRFGRQSPLVPGEALWALGRLTRTVRARDGVLAVLGNHDSWRMVEPFEALGLDFLINETRIIERGGDRLAVTGTDDVYRFETPDARAALAAGGRGDVAIAAVHSPELADEAEAAGYDLYLCGHTHGGQICLPGRHWVFVPLDRNRELARGGAWRRGRMLGYTSRGMGPSGLPLRFFCPPELTLFTLRRG